MENLIQLIRRKQFDFIFLERLEDQENHDENILIDPKEVTSSTNSKMWQNLGFVLDKASLLIIAIAYIIMSYTLIPLQNMIISNPIKTVA